LEVPFIKKQQNVYGDVELIKSNRRRKSDEKYGSELY
jgi:hypothetical protein